MALVVVISAVRVLADALSSALAAAGVPGDAIAVVADATELSDLQPPLPRVALVEFPAVVAGAEALLAAAVSIALLRDRRDEDAVRRLGATAVVEADDGLAALMVVLESVGGSEFAHSSPTAGPSPVAERKAGRPLTARQQEVLALARWLTNAEIAKELSIGLSTVKNHLHRAYVKLGIRGRHDLTDHGPT